MNEKRIEIGDTVRVFFNHSNMVNGVVDHKPCATGDSWIILESQAGLPVYVMTFDYMILAGKGEQV